MATELALCVDCQTERPAIGHNVCPDCQRQRTNLALEELIRTADAIIVSAERAKQRALDLQWEIVTSSVLLKN